MNIEQTRKIDRKKQVSRLRKPEDLSLEAWQVALRRQFAGEQDFKLRNIGGEPIFSEFEVTNPQTKRTYRVAIRGEGLGMNYCSCPDYATNTLGTCKHIEFTLGRLRRAKGAETAFAQGFHPAYSEVYLRYGAKREVVFQAGTECPTSLRKLAAKFFDKDNVLPSEAYCRFHEFLSRATGDVYGGHEVRCYDDAMEFISQARDRVELIHRIDAAFPKGAADKTFNSLLKIRLYAYQCEGALFAARAGRCLIADDMGLGKTIQAIAAAEILARHADIQRVLVICPTSLKHQWQREIEKFTGRSAVVVEGLMASRRQRYAAESFYKIVNYDVIHRDLEIIQQGEYDLIILDEAQRIKNWKTRAAQAVKKLDSDYAFVLTGTPLENRLEELHSIIEFVDRHRLGPMFRFLATHQHLDESGRVVGYKKLDDISRTLEPILVRRTKDAVLKELPERLEKQFFVPMTDQQMAHHEENREIVARIVLKWRRYGYISEIDQRRMTCALQNMRMSCNSTFLLDKETDHGYKADELATLLDEVLEDRDAKAVIFSQWLGTHELIVRRLAKRRLGHVLFHGGVPGPKRKDLVSRFREDSSCRLFLSTDAGGVGLNLQHASVVANMDLPWNPAVLEQRIGRVHRLGQHRPVRVINFIAKGTIEESMLGLLKFKKSMFTGVLDGGKNEVFLGGTRLKQFMDSVEKATTSIPNQVPSSDGDNGDGRIGPGGDAADLANTPTLRPTLADDSTSLSPTAGGAASRGGQSTPAGQLASPSQVLSDLLTTGAAFLHEIGQSLRQDPSAGVTDATGASGRLIGRDEATGKSYLKLPLPQSRESIQTLTSILQSVLAVMVPPN
ncbi:MAG: DEAD/DEAH box helicase [Phycisphaerae bacterium]|jgi:superfamily II DNA or RNA helicase